MRPDPRPLPPFGCSCVAWGDQRRGWGRQFNSSDLKLAFQTLNQNDINFFDTSEVYGYQGVRIFEGSEQLLGEFAAATKTPPIIATKFSPVPWANLLIGGGLRLGRSAALGALRNSLQRLGAASIALYSLAAPPPGGYGQRAFFEAAADAYQMGLIDAVGVCGFRARQLRDAVRLANQLDVPLLTNQVRFSYLNMDADLDGTIETCLELGIAPLARSPLGGGLATTRSAARSASGEDGVFQRGNGVLWQSWRSSQLDALVPALRVLSEVADVSERRTETQVALQFAISKGCIPLPSVTTGARASELVECNSWELSLDEVQALTESALELHVRRSDLPWLREL